MEERFNTVINEKYEENPYKRHYKKKINKIGFDCEDGEDNNIYNNNIKNNNIVSLDENKLKIFNQNFLNLNKNFLIQNKNDYKSNNNNIYQNNYFIYNNYNDNNNKINNNFNYPSINLSDLTNKEINTRHADMTPESISDKLYNSILRITLYKGEATGFFIKIKLNNKKKKCLFTCFHVISDQDIQNQITIDIYFGKKGKESHREIELDKNKRFMRAYKEEDVTLIEIIDEDNISDGKYLNPDCYYEFNYNRYLDKNFYLAGYPENHDERCISSGRIIEIGVYINYEKVNYKFYHKLDTRRGSSGSPITNDKGDVIGIHTDGIDSLNKNIGTFIGKILDNLKAEYNNGNNKNIHYININNNNDKVDKYHIKKPLFDEHYKKNFIQGKIYIKEEQIYKKIRVINSYENFTRELIKYGLYCDSIQGNEREIMENCVIKINDKEIPFSYYYIFTYSGIYTIEYSFKNYLINTSYMFFNCYSLINLDLSNFNTSNVTNMSFMFNGCQSLTNLNLSNFKTTNVTNMSYMFLNCYSLTNLNLSNFKTTNVTNMSYMFLNCYSLTNLDLSNFNTTNVTKMTAMFYGCFSLKNINLSNFKTTNVTDMSFMFYNCKSLTNLDLSNFITTNVTYMSFMFSNCESLTNLNLSNFNTTNATDMYSMFIYCDSLTNLNLPKNDKKTCEKIIYQYEINKKLRLQWNLNNKYIKP